MKKNFYNSFFAFAILMMAISFSATAQSTAGPIEVVSVAGDDTVMAGDNFPEIFQPGDVISIQGAYGNIGNAVAVWATYDIYQPDWSGLAYTDQQFIANDMVGVLDGSINFDYTLAADAPLFGAFDDATDPNDVKPAFHILQVRVAYEPMEDTFWNLFIVVDEESGTRQPVLEGLEIFPNPATDRLQITTPNNGKKIVRVYNMTGQTVIDTVLSGNELDISQLETGFHIVYVEEDGRVSGQKIMVK
jgi:hypothetical protein